MEKKILLIIFIFIPLINFSQSEDYFEWMGIDRQEILNSEFKKYERIYTGNYNELLYGVNEDTAISFGFDENNKCNMVIIKKKKKFYNDIILMLGSKFPNKNIGDIDFFWNSRMMVAIIKEEEIINIVYQKVSQKLLNDN